MLATFGEFPWIKLGTHDLLLLREQAYEISDNGDVKLKSDRFIRIDTNLKFLARTASRALGFEYKLDTGGDGWRSLMQAFEIRNRLVHPKAAADLIVRDNELKEISKAQDWFQAMHKDLWSRISDGLRGIRKETS
jgi:hypothetical protein